MPLTLILCTAAVFTGATILKLIADAQDARRSDDGDALAPARISDAGEAARSARGPANAIHDIAHRDGSVTL